MCDPKKLDADVALVVAIMALNRALVATEVRRQGPAPELAIA